MSEPTIDERRTLRQVRCVVACVNSNGEPDLFFVRVECTGEEYDHGAHYDCAEDAAKEEGYDPCLAYDEHDAAGSAMMDLFEWDTSSVYAVGGGMQRSTRQSRITPEDLGTAKARYHNLKAIAQFDPEVIAGAYWWGLNTQQERDEDLSPPTCSHGNCVGSGNCVDCCPDCDALRGDGFDDGPCERHAKVEMSEEEFKAWLTTQTREAAAQAIRDLIVKEARAQGITGLRIRGLQCETFCAKYLGRVDITPIRELLLLYRVAVGPEGLKATWTEEKGWQEIE